MQFTLLRKFPNMRTLVISYSTSNNEVTSGSSS